MEEKKEWTKENRQNRTYDPHHLWSHGYKKGIKRGIFRLFVIEALLYLAWMFFNM